MAGTSRIAVFRALFLGDLLVAVPAFRSLRAGFPRAEMTLIGLPWAASFAARFHRYIDRFVAFPGYPGLAEGGSDGGAVERFLPEQRAYRYDLAVQMHGSGRASNRLVHDLGARASAGYYEGRRPSFLTITAPYPGDRPEVVRNLDLAKLLGCPDTGLHLEFPLAQEDRLGADDLLGGVRDAGRPLIGIHPGAKRPAQRWPAGHFARAADALARRHGARIVLTGGPSDVETVQAVARRMEIEPLCLAGKTSLGCLGALIASLDLFLSNDTGPAHVAQAVGTPSIVLFGPAEQRRWAPLDTAHHPFLYRAVPCSPCSHWECPIDHRCLRRIDPEDVIRVAERLLSLGVAA